MYAVSWHTRELVANSPPLGLMTEAMFFSIMFVLLFGLLVWLFRL